LDISGRTNTTTLKGYFIFDGSIAIGNLAPISRAITKTITSKMETSVGT
jgi:hypothetical protein